MDKTDLRNAPIKTFRDGRLKSSVWRNENERGKYFTVTLAKVYEDQHGKPRDTHSFTSGELLRVAELARESHAYIRDLRRDRHLERPAPERAHAPTSDVPERFRT